MPPFIHEIPNHLLRVEDYRREAAHRLSHALWAFLDGAAGQELTHRRNLEAFSRSTIMPRVLRDLRHANTTITLAGNRHAHPIFVAPTAAHGLFHPEAELATCEAVNATDTTWVVSCQADTRIEDLAPRIRVPWWLQIYPQAHPDDTLDLIRRAADSGAAAVVLTVDAPLHVFRYREHLAGFRMPAHHGRANLSQYQTIIPDDRICGSALLANAPRWDGIARWVGLSPLPLFLKGILCTDDARLAGDAGAAGIIVSNHGGRVLDRLPATLDVLPALRATVPPGFPLLLDGGIRSGSDAFVALSLGANAVLCGRAPLYGLAVAGALGAAHVLQLMRRELEATMALAGSSVLEEDPCTLTMNPSNRFDAAADAAMTAATSA